MGNRLVTNIGIILLLAYVYVTQCSEQGAAVLSPFITTLKSEAEPKTKSCTDCLTVTKTKIIRNGIKVDSIRSGSHGVFVSSSQPNTTDGAAKKWKIECPNDDDVMNVFVQGIGLKGNDFIQLNTRRYTVPESTTCPCSTVKPYISKKSKVVVNLSSNQTTAAAKIYFVCFHNKDDNVVAVMANDLFQCTPLTDYVIESSLFHKLAAIILEPKNIPKAYQDPQICSLMELAINSQCITAELEFRCKINN